MSFCILGIFSFAVSGVDGAVYQTISEGIFGGALFLLLGFIYERYADLEIASYGGLAARMPNLATLFVISSLSLIGLPIAERLCRRVSHPQRQLPGHRRLGFRGHRGRHPERGVHAVVIQRVFYGSKSAMVTERSTPDMGFREASRCGRWRF